MTGQGSHWGRSTAASVLFPGRQVRLLVHPPPKRVNFGICYHFWIHLSFLQFTEHITVSSWFELGSGLGQSKAAQSRRLGSTSPGVLQCRWKDPEVEKAHSTLGAGRCWKRGGMARHGTGTQGGCLPDRPWPQGLRYPSSPATAYSGHPPLAFVLCSQQPSSCLVPCALDRDMDTKGDDLCEAPQHLSPGRLRWGEAARA